MSGAKKVFSQIIITVKCDNYCFFVVMNPSLVSAKINKVTWLGRIEKMERVKGFKVMQREEEMQLSSSNKRNLEQVIMKDAMNRV